MKDYVNDLKKEITELFKDKGNTYDCSDRLQVALHEILDNWVSIISTSDMMTYLADFDDTDFNTLDSGLYEGVLEQRGLNTFHRVLLYCLVEQDLYNEDDFNSLQFKTKVAGIRLT